jgi:hypothetical protein
MMTPTEILNEIHKLPPAQQKELKEKLFEETGANGATKPQMSEEEFLQQLYAEGFITHIPEKYTDEDDDFEPVEIEGEPISETIIRERR